MNRTTRSSAALLVAATGLLLAPAAQAAPPPDLLVDFTGESPGSKPNGYATAASADVRFYDTIGANLSVADFGVQSNGVGIAALSDDASGLEIRLASATTSIRLAFGNDDPTVVNNTDQARLTAFRGSAEVGRVQVNVNANDAMDQTIGLAGVIFNRVVIQYVDAAETPVNLIEVVDDVSVGALCTVVGNDRNNRLVGTAGPDVICAGGGSDVVSGLGGDDVVYAGPGKDRVNGRAGNDHVVGGSSNDRLTGGPGADTLLGAKGRDRLAGGAGVDRCDGGPGRDRAVSCEHQSRIP